MDRQGALSLSPRPSTGSMGQGSRGCTGSLVTGQRAGQASPQSQHRTALPRRMGKRHQAVHVERASPCPARRIGMRLLQSDGGVRRLLERVEGRVGGAEIEGSQGFWTGRASDIEFPETRPYVGVGVRRHQGGHLPVSSAKSNPVWHENCYVRHRR